MDNTGFEPDVDAKSGPEVSDTSIDIPKADTIPDKPYAGMGKDDLLRFSQTPFWNRLRNTCLVIFWGAWVALLVAVVVLTVVAPRCDPPPEQTWWQRTVVYQVYVRSFYDSDGNGIGDLNGVTAKLDYIQSLNAETVVLSAFYPSHEGEADRTSNFGYDITNHKGVDPDYGTLEDFDNLIEEAHARDMKVLIDFVPNHTGDKHPWFDLSAASSDPSNEYWNYYVWTDCANTPNWLSVYGDDAFVDDAVPRGECYLNQFFQSGAIPVDARQPDLNLRSSAVRTELEEILRFWLDKNVDGFRVMDAKFLYEDADLNDEIEICQDGTYECLDHSRTTNQPETFEIISSWRGILEEYSADQAKILITDARDTVNTTVRYYGLGGNTGAHLPLNYQLLQIDPGTTTGTQVQTLVEDYVSSLPETSTPDWLTGYQDEPRLASKLAANQGAFSRSLAVLKMTLPGPPVIYYGEELNMVDGTNTSVDPTGLERDFYRTPMQWDNTTNGGFQNITEPPSAQPWIPVNADFATVNVADFERDEDSILNLYKQLAEMKLTDDGLAFGDLEYATVDESVFSFVRQFDGTNRYLVAINFGADGEFNLNQGEADVPGSAELVVDTASSADGNSRKVGDNINLRQVALNQGEAVVVMWPFSR